MNHRRSILLFGTFCVGAVSALVWCNPFDDEDAPPESILPGGTFSVTPCGFTFTVVAGAADSGATGPTETFAIQGLQPSQLGSEGVPVTVALGQCPNAAEGGAGSSINASAGSGEGCGDHSWIPVLGGQISLSALADSGCSGVSPSLMNCLLRADGTATFGVTATLPMTSTAGQAIPVCVAPNGAAPTVIPIEISSVVDGGSLGVAVASAVPPAQLPSVGSCTALIPPTGSGAACGVVRTVPVAVQLLQQDASVPAQTVLSANVSLTPANSGAYLVPPGTQCGSGAVFSQVPATINAGSTVSDTASLCADGRGNSYALTAVSVSDPSVTAGNAVVVAAAQPSRVALATTDAGVGTATVFDCLGQPVPGVPLSVGGSAPGSTDDAGNFVFQLGDAGSPIPVQVLSTGQTCQGTLQ